VKNGIAIIGLTLLLAGCTHTAPQRPSQRKGASPQADTTALAMMELNQQLAQAADEQLLRLAQAQPEPYALYERGVWAYVEEQGDTERLVRNGEECTVRMTVYSLSGDRYTDSEITACVGKYELPAALDDNMPEWHHGARVRMFAPWYAAYGIKGEGAIPPYENVIIELEIK
jgi:hypothetical protein